MKRFFVSALCAAFSVAAFAQYQGEITVGGNLGIGTSTDWTSSTIQTVVGGSTSTTKYPAVKTNGNTNFGFQAEASYFVIDYLSATLGVSYGLTSSDNGMKNVNMAMGVIGANYYVSLIDDRFFYTPGVQLGFGGGSVNTRTTSRQYNSSTGNLEEVTQRTSTPLGFILQADFQLGRIEFKPNDRWGVYADLLTLCVTYNTQSNKVDNSAGSVTTYTDNTDLKFGLNYGFMAGVRYYFR